MAKKCKKLEEIKEMFKDNSIDIDLLSTDELKKYWEYLNYKKIIASNIK